MRSDEELDKRQPPHRYRLINRLATSLGQDAIGGFASLGPRLAEVELSQKDKLQPSVGLWSHL